MPAEDIRSGDPATAELLTRKLSEPLRQLEMRVAALEVAAEQREPLIRHGWLGVIRTTGPKGDEDDFVTANYWVEKLVSNGHDEDTDPLQMLKAKGEKEVFKEVVSTATYAVATNLSEITYSDGGVITSRGHGAQAGTLVRVFTLFGLGGKFHYFISGSGTTLVLVGSSATGGGKYSGWVLGSPAADTDIPATGNLSLAEIGVAASACRIINTAEMGLGTHDLDTGSLPTVFPAVFVKMATDGVPVYAIAGVQVEDCVPA